MQLQLPLLCEGHIGICDWNSSILQLLPLRDGHLIFFSFSLVTTVITTPAPLRGAYYAPSRKEKKLMITTHATLWETISGRATIYRYPILQHSPMRALKKKSTNGRCDYNSRSSTKNALQIVNDSRCLKDAAITTRSNPAMNYMGLYRRIC